MVPNADGTARVSRPWPYWRRIIRPGRVAYRVAAALADGEPISWPHVRGLTRTADDRGLVDALAWIASLARANHAPSASGRETAALPLPLALILQLTAVCLAAGVLAGLLYAPHAHRFWVSQLGLAFSFGSAAALLRFGGREDARAQWLMATYVLIAWAFAKPLAMDAPGAALVRGFCPEAFLAYTLWRFAEVFPRTERFTWIDRTSYTFGNVSLFAGSTLFVVNALLAWNPAVAGGALAPLGRSHPAQTFWDVVYVLLLPAALAIPLRTWSAPPAERQRVWLFGAALGAGLLPMLVIGLIKQVFANASMLLDRSNTLRNGTDVFVLAALLATPWLTVHAVLVRRALRVRVVLLKATQYALARHTLTVLVALPLLALGVWIYRNRAQPVAELFATFTAQLLVIGLTLGLAVAAARSRLLTVLDRLFSRTQLSHTHYLARCTRDLQLARSAPGIALALETHIREAFGVRSVSLLQWTPEGYATPVYGPAAPLWRHSALLAVIEETTTPVPLSGPSVFGLLPHGDREWVCACDAGILVPLRRGDGTLSAVLVIGQKPSGLPWDSSDALALSAVASAAGIALTSFSHDAGRETHIEPEFAAECVDCGVVSMPHDGRCRCGGEWSPAALPPVLGRKFAVEQRIGRGGMGLVYRAQDLTLGRTVALKTLPRIDLDALRRLRDEARSMARVLDSHLALIFGVESWRETPVLVIEYLHGGTLAQRLHHGPLNAADVCALATGVASALGVLHGNGLVHGDVKPSNIGFTADGTCKLLDFGLARALPARTKTDTQTEGGSDATLSSCAFGGTPAYLSPEVVGGERPSIRSDLWALGVVLLEALCGKNPFAEQTLDRAFARIRSPFGIVQQQCAVLDVEIASLFTTLLHPDVDKRPASAKDFVDLLAPHFAGLVEIERGRSNAC